jgi:purine-binding chemotaxis protein CheW
MADEIMREDFDEEELERDQYLVFSVKSQEFGFQAVQVQEITAVLGATEVPNAPPYVEGIVNLRGQLATLISFRKKFGFDTKEHDEDTRVVIVEQRGFPIGILVDSVEEVIKIPDEMVQELPEATGASVSEESIMGVGMLDDRLIILLDVEKFLTKAEVLEAGAISQMIEEARQKAGEAENDEEVNTTTNSE